MPKKRTKANIEARRKSDLNFIILDKDGKAETKIEEGIISKIPKERNLNKDDNIRE